METQDDSLSELLHLYMLSQSNDTFNLNVTLPLMDFRETKKSVQSSSVTFLIDFIYVLDKFGVPILFAVGFISNIILSITIRNSELKNVAAYCYFFGMGIVDTLYLVAMAIPWISIRLVDIYNTEGFCQLVYYLNLLTTFLSSWYLVLLLFERLCVCFKPKTAQRFMHAFRVKCYITAVSIFSIVGHLYLTWTSGVFTFNDRKICNVIPEHAKDIMFMRKIDMALGFFLPVFLILLLSVPLIVHICSTLCKCNDGLLKVEIRMITLEVRLNSTHTTRYSECPSSSSRTDANRTNQKSRLLKISQNRRLTLTSFFLALVYVVLAVPHNVIKTRLTFMSGDQFVSFEDSLFLKLFEDLFKLNFAYKAFVYFSFLPEMRENFIAICLCKSRKKHLSNQQDKGAP